MEVAIILTWLSCVLTFVSSAKQDLATIKQAKWVVWTIFTLLISVSWFLMSAVHPWISAGLMVLAAVMMMWTAIILAHGHLKLKILPFTLIGGL